MSATERDIVFHLLDIQSRDMRVEAEHDDVRELAYETNSDVSDDEEFKPRRRKVTGGAGKRSGGGQREFVIHLFGSTDTGRPIRCDVSGFRPTLYIRLPEEKTAAASEIIKQYMLSQGIPMSEINCKRVMKKVFYGFTANTFYPFLQVDVPSLSLFRNIKNLFLNEFLMPATKRPLDGPLKGKTVEIFEANIDPMLRFIHTQNIQPCGWILVKDGISSISSDDEKEGIVIECDYEDIIPTKGPRVAAPFLTASWDIECFSMTGDFPLAKRTWKKTAKEVLLNTASAIDAANLILNSLSVGQDPVDTLPTGMTPIYCQLKRPLEIISKKLLDAGVQSFIQGVLSSAEDLDERIGVLEKFLTKTLNGLVYLVGDPVIQIGTTLTRGTADTTERHLFVFPDCAPIPGIEVHAYSTEKAMILGWFDWMVRRNPDILIGYNVFGFDEAYLWHRAEELGIITGNSIIHQFTRLSALSSEMKLEEKFLSSSAMGDNLMYIWTTHGRLQIDLFHYIKRNNVLPSYKLDEVTKHFMSGKLKSQTYDAATGKLVLDVAGAIKDVRCGRAITLLDETGETVSDKLVVESVEGSKITFTCELDEDKLANMEDATKWVIVKDDVSPQDIFRLHRESAEGRAIVGKYCLPEDSHQILTNYGYMYLHELLDLWGENINIPPKDENLLIAGYNTETKQLIYERPNCLILNDYCIDQDMIEFTQNTYSDRWDNDNIFGLTKSQYCSITNTYKEDIEYKVPNFVSLITTPEHDMYVRAGVATGDKNQYVRMTKGKDRKQIPFKKIKARDLIGEKAPTAIKLCGRIENGVMQRNNINSVYPFTEESRLNLNTPIKRKAFMELYGYWLGDGSILVKRNKMTCITFNIVKKTDIVWIHNIIKILELKKCTVSKCNKEHSIPDCSDGIYKIPRQNQYVIKIYDEEYLKLFFDEYDKKYLVTDATRSQDAAQSFSASAKIVKNSNDISSIDTNIKNHHTIRQHENENIKSAKWMMNWVWDLDIEYSRAIIDGLIMADGSHIHGKPLKHIFTSSTRFRDEVERLALHAGYAPYSTVGYLAGSVRGHTSKGDPIIANHTSWIVNFPENIQFSEPTLKINDGDIKKIKYTGRTWCVSMPSTFIVARRAKCVNGIVSHASRPIVIGNCLQDCDLVLDLYKKLETFNNTMSMANVCSVPVSYIFIRGQGIKIESLIFKACRERDIVIPVLPTPKQGGGEDSYEGAIVLTPEPGFYSTSPIGVCDFASLYPSTIVSENISHDSLVWVKDFTADGTLIAHNWGSDEFAERDGYAYTDIEYDIWRPDPADTRKVPVKVKCGRRICRYAQPLDGSKSTLPQITTWLLNAREAKKKEMKGEKDPERYALLDAEQLAYKLTGNSLYGQLGSGTFKIRLQALAASVTAYGRKQILFAKEAIEKFYGAEAKDPRCAARCMAKVVYGDSVTGDTPLVLKNVKTNNIFIKRIDELFNEDAWNTYHDTKEAIDLSENDLFVWTDSGFTQINKIIRHRLHPEKKMFRINTHIGVVDVTEDHSLVLADKTEVKPSDVKIGTELLHRDVFQEFEESVYHSEITEDEAFVMGLFVADGSSDRYECPSGIKYSWAINKADLGLLVTASEKCPFPTKIINTIESSGVHKLIPTDGDIKTHALRYRELFYNQHREKRIPEEILNAPLNIVEAFWNGFYAGDGDKDTKGFIRVDQKGKEIGAGLFILARRLGYSVSINERATKENTFRYTMTEGKQRRNPIAIKKIRELPHTGDAYVYDLETCNHHFGVGPGALIVHNTDSLFVEFNVKNPETGELLQGREARQATIDITDEAGAFITKVLAAPHDFEFDKAFDPLLMFSKKRYAGNMYEFNADEYVHKYMGIALKRRDNAPIVKTIFGGAMKMLLNARDVAGAFKFVKDKCLELVDGKVSLGQLTVTKSLRADYADPTRIAHKALADRIAARDPGNAPAAGDRIGYVYICPKAGQEASKLQGDRIETPLYIKENSLVPDFRHYIEHQLQNPISQAFGLLVERIPGFTPDMMDKCPKKPPFMDGSLESEKQLDAWLIYRESLAAKLLFSECLRRFETASRRSAMMNMFGSGAKISTIGSSGERKAAGGAGVSASSQIAVPIKKKVVTQSTISSFLLDSFIVDTKKKKERAEAAKEKAAAKKKATK